MIASHVLCAFCILGTECCRADAGSVWQDQVRAARTLQSEGRHVDAATILSSVLRDAERLNLPAPDRVLILSDLGGLHLGLGRYSEAESFLQRSLAMRDRVPQVPPHVWLEVLNDLILVYTETGELARGQKLAEKTLQSEGQALNMYPMQRARTLHSLATIYYFRKMYDEAKTLLQDTVTLLDQQADAGGVNKMYALTTLARVFLRGEPEQAISAIERARGIGETILGPQHPGLARVLITEAAVYRSTGRMTQAEAPIQQALAILQGNNYRPMMQAALEEYAALLRQTGRGGEAKATERRARGIREEIQRDSAAPHKVDITTLRAVDR